MISFFSLYFAPLHCGRFVQNVFILVSLHKALCFVLLLSQCSELYTHVTKIKSNFLLLQDGPLPYPQGDRLIMGLTTIQVIGIAIGSIALLLVFMGIVVIILKRFLPGCKNFQFAAPHDTQVLVIEGPEDGDSDMDDDDNCDDEEHEIESA